MTDAVTGWSGADVPPGAYVPCAELVEELTDYLEGALPPERATLVEQHLGLCEGCRSLRVQWDVVIDLAARAAPGPADALDPAARARLLAAFRSREAP